METNIERICEQVYGVGIASAPVEAVLWAADRITDKEIARKELTRANLIRARYGRPLAYAPYGSNAF